LHYISSGSGSPVVVLDSGLGGDISQWRLVHPEVAKFTRVISYDRAGLGWSDRGPRDRTSKQIVKELHTMLKQAEVPGPYVLVGSSFGGYNVQLFAHEYPDQVAGLVLVDSPIDLTHEEIPESYRRFSENTARYAKWAFLVRFGIVHLVAAKALENSPPKAREERLSLISNEGMDTAARYPACGFISIKVSSAAGTGRGSVGCGKSPTQTTCGNRRSIKQ
jgi:pimeloyl-ACP methyl ester carboxylesterase